MKKLFLNSIQEVENLKNLLHSNQISYRYLKMKRQYLFNYPESLQEKIVELGYQSFSHSHNELTTNELFSSQGIMALFKKLNNLPSC